MDGVVYRAWPEPVVMAELAVFKEFMYGGAGPEELQRGLLGIDFLTRASELSDTARMLIDAAVDEAEMRIALMLAKEADDRTAEENRARLIRTMRSVVAGFDAITRLVEHAKNRFETVGELETYLAGIRRHQAAY